VAPRGARAAGRARVREALRGERRHVGDGGSHRARASGDVYGEPCQRRGVPARVPQRRLPAVLHASGRRERGQFVVEGPTLVQRAIHDGLPVEAVLYTSELLRRAEGALLLADARRAGIEHFLVTEGLLGKVTTTRPVPATVATVAARLRDAGQFQMGPETSLLVVENVANPDNLGMILRTADAAGLEGVVLLGAQPDPFHKKAGRWISARPTSAWIERSACRKGIVPAKPRNEGDEDGDGSQDGQVCIVPSRAWRIGARSALECGSPMPLLFDHRTR
jgi:MRM3-like substrate binding domain